jgi:hypothetical protein
MHTLYRKTVLVLNKNWQAINVTTPANALSMMFSETATGLEIRGEECMVPHKWHQWTLTEILPDDETINTPRGKIKLPKIIITSNFDKVPLRKLRFSLKNLWNRDRGRCQYTGKLLSTSNGNVDHIIPKSRGGKTTWTNCVLCHKDVNSKKGDKTPVEAGLRLLSVPKEPFFLPSTMCIKNPLNIKEWNTFLIK